MAVDDGDTTVVPPSTELQETCAPPHPIHSYLHAASPSLVPYHSKAKVASLCPLQIFEMLLHIVSSYSFCPAMLSQKSTPACQSLYIYLNCHQPAQHQGGGSTCPVEVPPLMSVSLLKTIERKQKLSGGATEEERERSRKQKVLAPFWCW